MVSTTATFDEYRFENDVNVWEAYNNENERWLVYSTGEEKWGQTIYKAKRVDEEAEKFNEEEFVSNAKAKNFALEQLDS